MKVLSLFDGMACGMLAMQAAGIKVDRYVAYEINKYAVQTSSHNFPMIEHKGDVFHADFTEYSGFDFLVGGSPCTYWSIAQKNNRETEASGMGWELFSQYVRALKEAQPMWFIYENNKSMSNAIRESITQAFGFEPVCINSALVSAQNRQRLYWVGKRNPNGTYSRVRVDQPEDKGILLRDVLDHAVALREKANCLCGNRGGTSLAHDLEKAKHNYAAEPVCTLASGKSRCVTAGYANKGAKHILESYFSDNPSKQQWDSVAEPVPSFAIPCEWDESGRPTKAVSAVDGKTYTVYEVKNGQITIKHKQYPIKLADGIYIIRKLTVSECKRLQTVPEWYEFPVSDSQAFRQLGNGWTVLIIAHLINATQANGLAEEQLDFFKITEQWG